jgi:hypothetical protein
MIDRYTKVLLTVIAVNLTVMVGWGAVKVLVPEVRAYDNKVYVEGGYLDRVYVEGGYLDSVKTVRKVQSITGTVSVDGLVYVSGGDINVTGMVSTCNMC